MSVEDVVVVDASPSAAAPADVAALLERSQLVRKMVDKRLSRTASATARPRKELLRELAVKVQRDITDRGGWLGDEKDGVCDSLGEAASCLEVLR